MRISDFTMEELLVRSGVATTEQVATLKEEGIRSRRPLQEVVLDSQLVDEKGLTQAFATFTQIPYIEIDPNKIAFDILNKIPEHIAKQYNAVLFKVDEDGTNHLAMDDPDDVQAINFIVKEIGANKR